MDIKAQKVEEMRVRVSAAYRMKMQKVEEVLMQMEDEGLLFFDLVYGFLNKRLIKVMSFEALDERRASLDHEADCIEEIRRLVSEADERLSGLKRD